MHLVRAWTEHHLYSDVNSLLDHTKYPWDCSRQPICPCCGSRPPPASVVLSCEHEVQALSPPHCFRKVGSATCPRKAALQTDTLPCGECHLPGLSVHHEVQGQPRHTCASAITCRASSEGEARALPSGAPLAPRLRRSVGPACPGIRAPGVPAPCSGSQ